MSAPPDVDPTIWVLIVTNFAESFLGLVITAISYHSYRLNEDKRSLLTATVGFGLLTLGTMVAPAYQLGILGSHLIPTSDNVLLQIAEAAIISLGFAVLFVSIYRYSSGYRRHRITLTELEEDFSE